MPPSETSLMAAQTPTPSFWDSLAGWGFQGMKIDKANLRQRVLIPEYLRAAIANAILTKDAASAAETVAKGAADGAGVGAAAPEVPLVVFVNSKSGGRQGKVVVGRLQELISHEQVFDLSVTKPADFINHGLSCLEKLAALGDQCAKATRERLRIMVAGGDGTIGWVLESIGELYKQKRMPVPPTGIIPLGTGNDLASSFGWGGAFPFPWRSAMKTYLLKAVSSPISPLDSWHVTLTTKEGEHLKLPYSLKHAKEYNINQLDTGIEVLPESVACYEGVFYNYFSIGMDAQVAYGFHHLREKKPYLARGPFANKLIYSSFSCTQGWFLTPCLNTPGLRGLNDILRIYIKKVNCSEWDEVPLPSSVRSIVALNLGSYGSGRHPWGHPTPKYLEKRQFVEAHSDDGLLEIFGLKQGWHASMVMVELISAKHIAQAAAIKLELRGGDWKKTYLQMDGEPWKQPISDEYNTYINITRVPFQSRMINAK